MDASFAELIAGVRVGSPLGKVDRRHVLSELVRETAPTDCTRNETKESLRHSQEVLTEARLAKYVLTRYARGAILVM